MLYHLVHDDKFISLAYKQFEEAFPNENVFIYPYKENTIFTKNVPLKKWDVKETIRFFNENIQPDDLLIIHYLGLSKINIINEIKKRCPFIWIGWGNDYYPLIIEDINKLLLKDTKKLYLSDFPKTVILKNYIYNKLNPLSKKILNCTAKIDYINTVIPDDYELIIKNHPDFKPKYFSWNYGNVSYLRPELPENSEKKQNILIGNSSTPANNHVEIIKFLNKLKLDERKVICPLNYGNKAYGKKIINLGKNLLGEHFIALTEFLPLNEYYRLISSCISVFMNHLRQQALGNILSLMYLGCNIILNEENPLYRYFTRNGFYVLSLKEAEMNPEIIFTPISENKKNHNISLIEENWNDKLMLSKTQNFKLLYEDRTSQS